MKLSKIGCIASSRFGDSAANSIRRLLTQLRRSMSAESQARRSAGLSRSSAASSIEISGARGDRADRGSREERREKYVVAAARG
jgi:hypothetical protein